MLPSAASLSAACAALRVLCTRPRASGAQAADAWGALTQLMRHAMLLLMRRGLLDDVATRRAVCDALRRVREAIAGVLEGTGGTAVMMNALLRLGEGATCERAPINVAT